MAVQSCVVPPTQPMIPLTCTTPSLSSVNEILFFVVLLNEHRRPTGAQGKTNGRRNKKTIILLISLAATQRVGKKDLHQVIFF